MRTTSSHSRLRLGFILPIAALLSGHCRAQSNPYSPKFINKTIVDSGEISVGQKQKTRTLLTVDRDDRVELYVVRITDGAPLPEPEFERYLGNRLYYSGQTLFGSALPANVVPTAAFQAVFVSGQKFHVVLGLVLQKSKELTRATYNIYVLQQDAKSGSLRQVAKEEELDVEPGFFTVLPSADGNAYRVIDIGGGDGPELATVRSLGPDGGLRYVQSFSAYQIKFFQPFLDRYGSFLLIEKADCNGSKADFCYNHKSLEWSEHKQQYMPPQSPR
jgi:hypothetical protein